MGLDTELSPNALLSPVLGSIGPERVSRTDLGIGGLDLRGKPNSPSLTSDCRPTTSKTLLHIQP